MSIRSKFRFLWHIFFMLLLSFFIFLGLFIWMNSYTKHGEFVSIPDIKGLSVEAAEKMLENSGLKYEISDSVYAKDVPAGTVFETVPEINTKVKPKRTIFLKINARAPRLIEIPATIEGMSMRQAKATLIGLGFSVEGTKKVYGNFNGLVKGVESLTGDSIALGSKLVAGSGLILRVSATGNTPNFQSGTIPTNEEIMNQVLQATDSPQVSSSDEENWW